MVIVLKLSPSSAREKCKALGIATPVMNHQQEPELMEALKRAEVVGNNAKEVCTIQLQHVLKLAKAVLGATDEATMNLQHMVGNSKGPEAQRYGLTSTSSRTRKGKGKEDNPVLPQYQDPIVHQSIWESATVRTPGPTTYHHQVPTPPPLFSLRPSQPRNPLSSVIPGGHSTPTSRGHPPPPPAIRLPAYLRSDPWPTTLPTVVLSEGGLTDLYGLVKPGPGIRREIKVYEEWCLAPINTDRRGMYVAPVQSTSLDRVQTMILGFLGYTSKHWQLDVQGLSLDLYADPWCIAQFIAFLVVSSCQLYPYDSRCSSSFIHY